MTDHRLIEIPVDESPRFAGVGAKEPTSVAQELFDRAQVPIHQGVLAIANILGDGHELFALGQEFRGKLNEEIARRRK